MFLIQRSLLLAVFIPHEDFTPQKYVHSSTWGSVEGGGGVSPLRGPGGISPWMGGSWASGPPTGVREKCPPMGIRGQIPQRKICLVNVYCNFIVLYRVPFKLPSSTPLLLEPFYRFPFEHSMYTCITHLTYIYQVSIQLWNVQNPKECSNPSILELQLDLYVSYDSWLLSHLLGKCHLHYTFHIHKTTPCGESYEKNHLN
jgi:hypothetical protein